MHRMQGVLGLETKVNNSLQLLTMKQETELDAEGVLGWCGWYFSEKDNEAREFTREKEERRLRDMMVIMCFNKMF